MGTFEDKKAPHRWVRGWGIQSLCLPQTMQVAVLVSSNHLVAGGQSEGDHGLLAGLQVLELFALLGFQSDPLDGVLFSHGVQGGTNDDLDQAAFHLNHGDMLFHSGVSGLGDQFDHLFAAADDLGAVILNISNDVAAMIALIELHNDFSFRFVPC